MTETPIGDPRDTGEEGTAGDPRPAGEEGTAGDPREAGEGYTGREAGEGDEPEAQPAAEPTTEVGSDDDER